MQGQKIREAEADALPAGFHVTSLYPQADGTMWAVDDSLTAAEVQKLLRLDENGRVMEEYAMNENMGASAFQEAFMRVGGTVALLNRHKTSRDEQTSATHCGLMVLRNGRMEEMYVRGMDWSDLDFSRPKAASIFSREPQGVHIPARRTGLYRRNGRTYPGSVSMGDCGVAGISETPSDPVGRKGFCLRGERIDGHKKRRLIRLPV